MQKPYQLPQLQISRQILPCYVCFSLSCLGNLPPKQQQQHLGHHPAELTNAQPSTGLFKSVSYVGRWATGTELISWKVEYGGPQTQGGDL